MKHFTLFLSLFLLHALNGMSAIFPDKDILSWPDSTQNKIELSGNFYFGSNAITTRFAKAYYTGEFIHDQLKDKVSKKLINLNRFGGELKASIELSYKPDTFFNHTNCWWTLGISDVNSISGRFRKDAFEIYFRGNANYGGVNAQMSDFDFSLIHYQQIAEDMKLPLAIAFLHRTGGGS